MGLSIKSFLKGVSTDSPWFIVGIMLVGAFMALLDVTIVNVALPAIQHGINVSNTTLVWIVSAYALAFGLALIPAGRIGDNYGHKYVFITGLTILLLVVLVAAYHKMTFKLLLLELFRVWVLVYLFLPLELRLEFFLMEGKEAGLLARSGLPLEPVLR